MKNKVFVNRVSVDYIALYTRAKDYFKRHGVDISFELTPSDYKNLSYRIAQFPQGQRIILQPTMSQVVPLDPTYDFISFVFNGREFPPPNIPTGYCYGTGKQPFMDILTDELNPKDLDYVTICHEMMHALVMKATQAKFLVPDVMDTYYNAMQLESPDSNFGRQWVLLAPYIKSLTTNTMPTYLYFKPTESTGGGHTIADLKPALVDKLDKARDIAGTPFVITSGFRTVAENNAVGGVSNSAHLTGEATDIACSDSAKRMKIIKALLQVGFNRIEVATAHIHCDISKTLPQGVIVLSDKG